MAVHEVRMPQLGETVAEATVVSWLKAAGDSIDAAEALVEVSSDKVDTEVPTTVPGVVARLLVAEGETVDVGTVIAEIEPVASEPGAAPAAPTPAAAAERTPAGAAPPSGPDAGAMISPVVRRMVADHGLDLAELTAFADGARVSRKVVDDFLASRTAGGAPTSGPAPAAQDELVPFTRIRRRTAEHMVASKATAPHVITAMEVDFEDVHAVRDSLRERPGDAPAPSFLAFVAVATVQALQAAPWLNAEVVTDGLLVHPDVHLGIAVDLDGEGLIVPVVRAAQQLGPAAMAAAIADLAQRARTRRLAPDDVQGGTFTISSQGPYGTLMTGAIINQPQVAILSVDGIRKRAVVVSGPDGDEVAPRHTGVLTLSWDHRAIDGVYASRFLADLRDRIEQTDWAAELSEPRRA